MGDYDLALQNLQEKFPTLTVREIKAYLEFKNEGKSIDGISPYVIAGYYALFLNGKSLVEIERVAKNKPSLGELAVMRAELHWDAKRKEYIQGLMAQEQEKLVKARVESVSFIADGLSAAHKMMGEKLIRYLQTGDEHEVKDIPVGSLGFYKGLHELLRGLLEVQNNTLNVNINQTSNEKTVDGKVERNGDEVRAALLAGLVGKIKDGTK